MNKQRLLGLCILTAVAGSAPGCRLFPRPMPPSPPPPVVFAQPPGLEEVIATINTQSDRIMDIQADEARVSAARFPSLRANLRVQRPQRMRLKANFMGHPFLDLGSNDERFWLWTVDSPVYYARHDQFASSMAQQLLPVEPTWLIEAMGLIHLAPGGPHQGPYRREDGGIEIHTQIQTSSGPRIRVAAIHPQYGYVTEVQLRDLQGQLLAIARADRHRYDPQQQVTLPHRVQLELVGSQLPISSFTFETEHYVVNQLQLAGDNPNLWAMPPGASQDLADPRAQLPGLPGAGLPMQPAVPRAADARGYHPQYRGYER